MQRGRCYWRSLQRWMSCVLHVDWRHIGLGARAKVRVVVQHQQGGRPVALPAPLSAYLFCWPVCFNGPPCAPTITSPESTVPPPSFTSPESTLCPRHPSTPVAMYVEKRGRGRKRAREEDGQVTEAGQREDSEITECIDGVMNRAMDELDRLSASMMLKSEVRPLSVDSSTK